MHVPPPKDVRREHNVNVDMRIGVHTGFILSGIIGNKREEKTRNNHCAVLMLLCQTHIFNFNFNTIKTYTVPRRQMAVRHLVEGRDHRKPHGVGGGGGGRTHHQADQGTPERRIQVHGLSIGHPILA